MRGMENLHEYTPTLYALVGDLFALALSAHVVGFVYFLSLRPRVAPRYRMTTTISALVMVSSAFMFARLAMSWDGAFVLDGDVFVLGDSEFQGQLRYVNWAVTVPLLLSQLVVVLDMGRDRLVSTRMQLVGLGLGMVATGYVGQFSLGTDTGAAMLWFAISTAFYVGLLARLLPIVSEGTRLAGEAGRSFGLFRFFFLGAWSLYPAGYLAAAFVDSATGAALAQGLYTAADITSKVLYGVVLAKVARVRSAQDGFEGAHAHAHPGDAEASVEVTHGTPSVSGT